MVEGGSGGGVVGDSEAIDVEEAVAGVDFVFGGDVVGVVREQALRIPNWENAWNDFQMKFGRQDLYLINIFEVAWDYSSQSTEF